MLIYHGVRQPGLGSVIGVVIGVGLRLGVAGQPHERTILEAGLTRDDDLVACSEAGHRFDVVAIRNKRLDPNALHAADILARTSVSGHLSAPVRSMTLRSPQNRASGDM